MFIIIIIIFFNFYGDSEIEKVLDRQTALKGWIAMEMRWYRNYYYYYYYYYTSFPGKKDCAMYRMKHGSWDGP